MHSHDLKSKYSTGYVHHLIAQYAFNLILTVSHIYLDNGQKESMESLLSGNQRKIWQRTLSNYWELLAQGNDSGIKGTDTIVFINK